jgi:hypothetical protein
MSLIDGDLAHVSVTCEHELRISIVDSSGVPYPLVARERVETEAQVFECRIERAIANIRWDPVSG